MFRFFKGWRTVSANIVLLIIASADAMQLVSFVPDKYMFMYGLISFVMNIYLRFITDSPIGKKL